MWGLREGSPVRGTGLACQERPPHEAARGRTLERWPRRSSARRTGGRWVADVPALPGVLAYGATPEEAWARTEALALRVMADRR